jgi:hypothetical protein
MEKINIGTNALVYPMPVTLVGANVSGRYMARSQEMEETARQLNRCIRNTLRVLGACRGISLSRCGYATAGP